jgi:hypothetical protein
MPNDRDKLRWGRSIISIGAFLVLLAAISVGESLALPVIVVFSLGSVLLGLGLYRWTGARLSHLGRRRSLLYAAHEGSSPIASLPAR